MRESECQRMQGDARSNVRGCKGMYAVQGSVNLVLDLCDLMGRHVLDEDPFADDAQPCRRA